jgi:putative ABC transport system permease protein
MNGFAVLLFKNLRRSPRRTILTTLAIALAAFTYSSLAGLPYLTTQLFATPDSARRIVATNASGFFYGLPAAYRGKIAEIPHVLATSGFVYFGGNYRGPSDQLGVAIDADQADTMWPDWGFTRERVDRFRAIPTACLVPQPMMRKYGWHVGEQIMLRGTVEPVDVTLNIVDTLGPKAPPDALVFRRDYLDRLMGEVGRVNAYEIIVDRVESVPSVIAAVDETFANSSAETLTESEASWAMGFMDLGTLFAVLRVVAAAVALAVALIAANTIVMVVRERRSEIAVMRAIGFGPAQIFALVVAESALVGFAGGALGCGATFLLAKTLPVDLLPLGPMDLLAIIPPSVIAQAFTLSVAIGTLAAIWPALNSARQNVVDALRAVG